MNLSIAAVKDQSIKTGEALGGFIGAHTIVRLIKKDNIVTSLILLIGGLFLSMNVKNEHVQNMALGASMYGGIKALNNLAPVQGGGIKGLEGLGIALPESVASAIQQFIPNLGEIDLSGMGDIDLSGDYDLMGSEIVDLAEADYEILNGLDPELAGENGTGIGNVVV